MAGLGLITAAVAFIAPASAQAAYNLTVSSSATANVTCNSGVCTATGTGANLSVTDLQTELATGNVALSTGGGGTEAGTITVTASVAAGASMGGLTFQPAAGVTLDAVSLTTGGSQVYAGPVTLSGSTVITAPQTDFSSTLDGSYGLTVDGSAVFGSAVGSTVGLSSLVVSGSATLGGNVTTAQGQTYEGAVQLGTDVTLQSSAGGIDLASTVDGPHALTVMASGTASFGGAVGGTTALSSLVVTGPATLGGDVTTGQSQTFEGAVLLGTDVTLQSSGGGAINFASTVDGTHALTVRTFGQTNFGGALGTTNPLSSLFVSGQTNLGGDVTTTQGQTF